MTFWYNDHAAGEKQYRKMEVMDFISAVVGHIPDRNFKTIRYYGVYERGRSSIRAYSTAIRV